MHQVNIIPIVLQQLLFSIPSIVLLIGTMILFLRMKSAPAVLCLVGECINLIGIAGTTVFMIAATGGQTAAKTLGWFAMLMRVPYLIGSILFAIGFLLLVLRATPAPTVAAASPLQPPVVP